MWKSVRCGAEFGGASAQKMMCLGSEFVSSVVLRGDCACASSCCSCTRHQADLEAGLRTTASIGLGSCASCRHVAVQARCGAAGADFHQGFVDVDCEAAGLRLVVRDPGRVATTPTRCGQKNRETHMGLIRIRVGPPGCVQRILCTDASGAVWYSMWSCGGHAWSTNHYSG